jgi:OHCU decarboxylase
MRLDELNELSAERACAEFTKCCGSSRWARAMAARRPFAHMDAMFADAETVFESLGPSDWLEAFAAHPRIGDRPQPSAGAGAGAWSAEEQSGVTETSRGAFERRNRDYEARFGHIFIVCAAGRRADQMIQMLEERMLNNPDDELRQSAREQRQISRLRLGKLLS